MKKNFEKIIGTQICADIADIIKFFVKCDTVAELRHYFGEELGADFDYDNLLIEVEHIKKVYNKFRENFYDDSAAYLTAQASLLTMADTYKMVLDKDGRKTMRGQQPLAQTLILRFTSIWALIREI